MTTFHVLVSKSPTRMALRSCVDCEDEAHAAYVAAEWRGAQHPMVRYDGERWIVSDGHTTIGVQILKCE